VGGVFDLDGLDDSDDGFVVPAGEEHIAEVDRVLHRPAEVLDEARDVRALVATKDGVVKTGGTADLYLQGSRVERVLRKESGADFAVRVEGFFLLEVFVVAQETVADLAAAVLHEVMRVAHFPGTRDGVDVRVDLGFFCGREALFPDDVVVGGEGVVAVLAELVAGDTVYLVGDLRADRA